MYQKENILPISYGKTELMMLDEIKKYEESGLEQLKYCRLNKFSSAKLVYWLRKSRKSRI